MTATNLTGWDQKEDAMSSHTVALIWRMLHAGLTPKAVAETTGEDLGDVLELQQEMP